MHVGSAVIYVVDLPSMVKFYADVFDLAPIAGDHADTWQEFQAGAFRLGLHAIPRELLKNLDRGRS
jgi:predicted enzyme related to lactoylglutathione lyase